MSDNPLYKHDRTMRSNTEVSIRYHEYLEKYQAEQQMDNYAEGKGTFIGPQYFEPYQYALAVEGGAYMLNGETASKKYRIAECGYYRPAIKAYYGLKEFDHKMPVGDMLEMSKIAARLSTDLVLNTCYPDQQLHLLEVKDIELSQLSDAMDCVDRKVIFRMEKEAEFNELIHKKRAHTVLRRENLKSEMEAMGGVITAAYVNKFALHFRDENKLVTVVARCM